MWKKNILQPILLWSYYVSQAQVERQLDTLSMNSYTFNVQTNIIFDTFCVLNIRSEKRWSDVRVSCPERLEDVDIFSPAPKPKQ